MLKILNASPGFGAPFSEQEITDFLTTKVLMLHLGTVDEKGHPNVHPAWYYFDPVNNKIYVEHQNRPKRHTISERTKMFTFV